MLLSAGKRNIILNPPVTTETPFTTEFPLSLFIIGRAKPEPSKVAFQKTTAEKA